MNYVINDLPRFCTSADPNGAIMQLMTKNMLPIRIVPGRLKISFLEYIVDQGIFDMDENETSKEKTQNTLTGDIKSDLFSFKREMSNFASNYRNILYVMARNIGFSASEIANYLEDTGFASLFKKFSKNPITESKDKKERTSSDDTITGEYEIIKNVTDLIKTIFVNAITGYVDASSEGTYAFSNSYKESVILSGLDEMISGEFFGGLAAGIIDGARETLNYSEGAAKVAEKIKGNNPNGKLTQAVDALTKLASTKLVVPKVWDNSNASSSIDITFKLKAPFGDRHTIFNTVLSPFALLLCLTLPQQSLNLGYAMPYILAIDSPGVVQSPACVVTSLTYTRGGDSNLFSVDGLPLEMTVQLTIEDVFDSMYLPTTTKIFEGFSNSLNSNPIFYSFLNNITGYSPSANTLEDNLRKTVGNFVFNALNAPISFVENTFETNKDTGNKAISTMMDFFGWGGN